MESCSHPARSLKCVVKRFLEATLPLNPPVEGKVYEEAMVVCQACGGTWAAWRNLDIFARALEGRGQIVHLNN